MKFYDANVHNNGEDVGGFLVGLEGPPWFDGISKSQFAYVADAIRYTLHASFKNRVLMGSDLPFFNQMKVVEYYERFGKLDMLLGKLDMLNENFERAFTELSGRDLAV